ncbi:hypothetical protein [Pedobacter rhizosphaerae]|uniref:Ig-like domain-containing protein n=1 Tax=Pedobacter rhizosphaerae TaxID=390241 RepID=A0A1H9VC43_9SPHI|nr:hypothetical protein [Pedobacter rhizosphaerae]SES18833.1 hypothetical protein SAMN04488023_14030 [Pedobacter rhizosphaerae]
MNKFLTKTILTIAAIVLCSFLTLSAQTLAPNTAGVNLFCSGADLTLPAAPTGADWIVKYSATPTTTPSTGVILTGGNKIPNGDLKTGYYYLSSKSQTAGSCESEMQEIPVYVLKPLVPTITPAPFCVESPLAQIGNVTNPEDPTKAALVYQWYTVSGSTETIINGANTKDYTPTAPTVGSVTYRFRVGYEINGSKYCAQTVDETITVTAKPTKPTLTIGTAHGTAGAVTF